MSSSEVSRLVIALILNVVLILFSFMKISKKRLQISTKFIVRTAIFAAISTILYCVPYLKFPLPIFPQFLEIHLDEIPAFIAGFGYGPLCAFFVILIKTIIKLPLTTTACAGEFADLIYSLVFVVPASIIYKKNRSFKGAIVSLLVSSVIQIIVSSFFTSFVMLDIYSFMFNLPKESILAMSQAINPAVTNLGWPFLFMIALPFNALKDVIVIILTFILYKRVKFLLDKINQ